MKSWQEPGRTPWVSRRWQTVGEHQAISIVTYHPAAALRQGEVVERLIVADLVKAREMSSANL